MWKTVKLKDIADVKAGNPAPQDKNLFENGVYPFVRTSDVGKVKVGSLSDANDKLNQQGIAKLKLFPKGTILFPKSGASTFLNHRVILEMDAYVASHLATIKSKQEDVSDKYLWYFLQTIDAADLVADSAYPSLNTKTIQSISVPLPPLAEQQRIVAKLDIAFAEIDKAVKVTEKKKKQGRKLFQRVLSNSINKKSENESSLPLKEIAKFLDYRGKTPPKTESGIKLLTAKNVRMGFIRKQPEEFVSEEGYKQHMTRGFPKVGDVIFTTEAPLGLVAQIEDDSCALGQRLITFQILNNVIKSTYLKFALMSESYQKNILEKGTGATVKGIKASLLKEIKITFPVSLNEQLDRITQIEETEKTCDELTVNYTNQISLYQSLKSAILKQELQSSEAA